DVVAVAAADRRPGGAAGEDVVAAAAGDEGVVLEAVAGPVALVETDDVVALVGLDVDPADVQVGDAVHVAAVLQLDLHALDGEGAVEVVDDDGVVVVGGVDGEVAEEEGGDGGAGVEGEAVFEGLDGRPGPAGERRTTFPGEAGDDVAQPRQHGEDPFAS